MSIELDTSFNPQGWPSYRWWATVLFVLASQVVIIFWLGDQGPIAERSIAPALSIQLAGKVSSELLALNDPSLFALPHKETFAGQAWLAVPKLGAEPFIWSEPPQWLKLPLDQLGRGFRSFLETNQITPPPALAENEPQLTSYDPKRPPLPAQSTYRLLGDLAERELLTPFSLNTWTNAEPLTNSIVQVVVDAQGRPVSVTLLWPSGSSEVDKFALKIAEMARFEPTISAGAKPSNPLAGLKWGQIIFDWRTVPAPLTNSASGP
jgi:TonB family protein